MDEDYEKPKSDPAIYHDYIEPIAGDEYDSISVKSRDAQYEKLPPDDRPSVQPTSSHEYTPLNALTTATWSTSWDNASKTGLVNSLSNRFCRIRVHCSTVVFVPRCIECRAVYSHEKAVCLSVCQTRGL